MVELDIIKGDIETEIAIEESRIIHPINESDVITFLKRHTEYSKKEQCVDNLIKRKQLFDMFIDNVIYDGKNILITVKTIEDDPYETKKIDKKKLLKLCLSNFDLVQLIKLYSSPKTAEIGRIL